RGWRDSARTSAWRRAGLAGRWVPLWTLRSVQQGGGDVDVAGAQELAEGLADLVEGEVGRAAGREVAAQHERDAVQVRLFVAFDGDVPRAVQEFAEPVGGEERGQPRPRGFVSGPDAEVGVGALVPGACVDDLSERDGRGGTER